MGVGISAGRFGALALSLLAAAALWMALAGDAGAAKLIGKDGKVHACYKVKGKAKGAVRLVPKKHHCKHGERKIAWNAAGPAGEAGQNGESGGNGETGATGEKGATATLEHQVTVLTTKVNTLESILHGISNTELLGALSKLQGISGTQLQEAVASVADVKKLCAQAGALTEQTTKLGSALGGIELLGLTALELVVPQVAALPPFNC